MNNHINRQVNDVKQWHPCAYTCWKLVFRFVELWNIYQKKFDFVCDFLIQTHLYIIRKICDKKWCHILNILYYNKPKVIIQYSNVIYLFTLSMILFLCFENWSRTAYFWSTIEQITTIDTNTDNVITKSNQNICNTSHRIPETFSLELCYCYNRFAYFYVIFFRLWFCTTYVMVIKHAFNGFI